MSTEIDIRPMPIKSVFEALKEFGVTDVGSGGKSLRAASRPYSQVVDLATAYGLTPDESKRTIGEKYGTIAAVEAAYKYAVPQWRRDGLTDAEILSILAFPAAHTDALWMNADHIPAGGRGLCLSFNKIIWPLGPYYTNIPLDYAYGIVEGQGTGNGDDPSGKGSTEIKRDEARWIGKYPTKVVRAFAGGSDSVFAYSEGAQLRDFRVNGMCSDWAVAGREVIGVEAWDFGEASNMANVFIHKCDVGLDVCRGTPFTASGCISVFSNNIAGVRFSGAAGATVCFQTLSGDDNPALMLVSPGYGRPAGVGGHISAIKSEWAITPAGYGRTWKRQTIMAGEGWIKMTIGFLSPATGNVFQDAMFDINPNVNTSSIKVEMIRNFGSANIKALLHDQANNKTWMFDNGFVSDIHEFKWSSTGGGQLVSWPSQAVSVPAIHNNILGYLPGDQQTGQPIGSFVRDTDPGTPTWSNVTGNGGSTAPPPSCTWVLGVPGAWGDCVNGQQTRTTEYVSSVPGCIPPGPKPPAAQETQACQVQPPPAGSGSLLSLANVEITSAAATQPLSLSGKVRQIKFTNLLVTGDLNYRGIVWGATVQEGVRIQPNGTWIAPGGTVTCSTGKTNRNQLYPEMILTLSTPIEAKHLLAYPGTGSSLLFKADKLELIA